MKRIASARRRRWPWRCSPAVPSIWAADTRHAPMRAATLHRSVGRPQGPVLARPDGAGAALRQARQVALHGHAAGPRLRRQRRRQRRREDQPRGAAEPGHPPRDACGAPRCLRPFDAIGTVQFDERLNVAVQTRVAGYVERLAVRAPMERVRKGQALATVFAPEWLGAAERVARAAALRRRAGTRRRRARAYCAPCRFPAELVRQSERAGSAQARFVLSAPVGGVVAELGVREGAAVTPGHDAVSHCRPRQGLGAGRGARGAGARVSRPARR